MAKFLNTKGITAEISDIISRANQRIVIISPYVKIGNYFIEKLTAADKRGIPTILVCREETLEEDQKRKLLAIPKLQLLTHSNVHAKCYYNEVDLVMGSLNFYDYSDQNNREMGIALNLQNDGPLYTSAVREAEEIILMARQRGKNFSSNNWRNTVDSPSVSQKNIWQEPVPIFEKTHQGFCIRCHGSLHLNPHYPYCTECYKSWANWGNPDYTEKYCHCCGTQNQSTMAKPLCLDCYRSWNF